MREQVEAIYQNGILRPLTPLSLPENTWVDEARAAFEIAKSVRKFAKSLL